MAKAHGFRPRSRNLCKWPTSPTFHAHYDQKTSQVKSSFNWKEQGNATKESFPNITRSAAIIRIKREQWFHSAPCTISDMSSLQMQHLRTDTQSFRLEVKATLPKLKALAFICHNTGNQ